MQNQLLQSGFPPVSVSVLCRLFGVARSTTYDQPHGRHRGLRARRLVRLRAGRRLLLA